MNVEKLNGYARAFKDMCGIASTVAKELEKDGYHVDIDLDALDNNAHSFLKLYLLLWGVKDGKHIERWVEISSRDYMGGIDWPMCDENINHLLNLDNWHVGHEVIK